MQLELSIVAPFQRAEVHVERPAAGKSSGKRAPVGPLQLRRTRSAARVQRVADGVALLSLGLGLVGLLAPGVVAKVLGAKDCVRARTAIRAVSLGQVAAGVGVLTQRRPGPWLWTHVASDALDLALIARARAAGALPGRTALLVGAGLVGVAMLAAGTSLQARRVSPSGIPRSAYVNAAVTIQRSTHEVYHAFRDLQSLPRFISHVHSVTLEGATVRFRARLPGGLPLEWDIRLSNDVPGSKLAWESLPGSKLRSHGTITFVPAPGRRGTELRVVLHYEPPAGALGHALMKLLGMLPRERIRADLRRFKQILETGSIMHADVNTSI